jgi:hypothetical protein
MYSATMYVQDGRAVRSKRPARKRRRTALRRFKLMANKLSMSFKIQSVMPGEWIGGVVVLDAPTEANGTAKYGEIL